MFDGNKTIRIDKSLVRGLRRLNEADVVLDIPFSLAKRLGVV